MDSCLPGLININLLIVKVWKRKDQISFGISGFSDYFVKPDVILYMESIFKP